MQQGEKNMRSIFEEINNYSGSLGGLSIVTLLDEGQSLKALISDGSVLWQKAGALTEREVEILSGIRESGVVQVENRRFFCDTIGSRERLVICGAGHVGIACLRNAKLLGIPVTVVEDRDDFARLARQNGADTVICAPFKDALSELGGSRDTMYLVMSRAHAFDRDCLEVILRQEHGYVGMLGSLRKIDSIRASLLERGIESSAFDAVHTPVGLDIGASSPAEIAVSVMAEIIKCRADSGSVRECTLSHEMLDALMPGSEPAVLVTIIDPLSGGPRSTGTKMLVLKGGCTLGTVGGGLLESTAIKEAIEMLRVSADSEPDSEIGLTYAGRKKVIDAGIDPSEQKSGMLCGGSARLLLELL